MSDNRLASWTESVRVAKINLGKDPNELMEIRDELLAEAQKVYNHLVFDEGLRTSGVLPKGVTHEFFKKNIMGGSNCDNIKADI